MEHTDGAAKATTVRASRMRIGETLISLGFATRATIDSAASRDGAANGRLFGERLVANGDITWRQLAEALASQEDMPFYDVAALGATPGVLSEKAATERCAVCVRLERGKDSTTAHVALAKAKDHAARTALRDELVRNSKATKVVFGFGDPDAIKAAIARLHRRGDSLEDETSTLGAEMSAAGAASTVAGQDPLQTDANQAAKALASLFDKALDLGATDAHIEPRKDSYVARARVDGRLVLFAEFDRIAGHALVRRLKMEAGIDVNEHAKPQDGRLTHARAGAKIDARVSTGWTPHGADAVVRFLSASAMRLDDIVLDLSDLAAIRSLTDHANGIVLVSGPTGSGKTTLLFAMMSLIDATAQKIHTIEDPVELVVEEYSQHSVNDELGVGFAELLRATLRQDPDIILVGEIRDGDTARTATQAAQTGHLVLTTIHTNDAAGVAPRLIDLGAQPFSVADTLRGVIAQRLVRTLCPKCARQDLLTGLDAEWARSMDVPFGAAMTNGGTLPDGSPCPDCKGTGWLGRRAVHEILVPGAEYAAALGSGDKAGAARIAAERIGKETLQRKAAILAALGMTSVQEARRTASSV